MTKIGGVLASLYSGSLAFVTYRLGLTHFPISTVDFLLRRPDGKILLIKRAVGAYAGEWFVGGGRQHRGEILGEALLRVLKREVGLSGKDILKVVFSHCQDVYNPPSYHASGALSAWHSVWHLYVVHVPQDFIPKLDPTSIQCDWFDPMFPPAVPDPVTEVLVRTIHEGKLPRGQVV